MASKVIKGITIEVDGNTQKLNEALNKSKSETWALTKEMREIDNALKFNPGSIELLSEKSKLAEDKVKALSETLRILKENQEQINTGKDKAGNVLDSEVIKQYNREVIVTSASLQTAQGILDDTNSKLESFGEETKDAGEGVKLFGDLLKANIIGNLATDAIRRLTSELVDFAKGSINTAIEFESAFAGVAKTVDGTTEQLLGLKDGIRQMALEIPSSTTEISAVAEAAGQLGIETESILEFTEVMIGLGEATNLSSDEAASSLAKFANVTKMSQDKFDELGSVIVRLGNTFATTEADIVGMGTRLAAAGAQVGLTEAEIMGLASAMSAMGIEAEAGGTAMSKTMKDIQKAVELGGERLNSYAKVAGMSASEFKRAWEKDAAGALVKFISGLTSFEKEGKSAIAVLSEIGITEARQSDALLRLAGNTELVEKAVREGTAAWDENIALQNEVETRYNTTESQLKLTQNALNDLGITVGEAVIPAVRELSEGFRDFAADNKDEIRDIAERVGDALLFAAKNSDALITSVKALGFAFAAFKATETIDSVSKFVSGIKSAKSAADTTSQSVTGLTAALKLMSTPTGAAVAGIAAFAFAASELNKRFPPVLSQVEEFTESLNETVKQCEQLTDAVDKQREAFENSVTEIEGQSTANSRLADEIYSLAEAERYAIQAGEGSAANRALILAKVEELNRMVPGLALAYDEETGALNRAFDSTQRYIEAKKEELTFQAYMEQQLNIRKQIVDIETQINKVKREQIELQDASDNSERVTRTLINEANRKKAVEESAKALEELASKKDELEQTYEELGNAAAAHAETVEQANSQIAESEKAVQDAFEETTEVSEEERKRQEEIFEAYAAHTQNIFDTIDEKVGISVDTLISNLKRNQEAVKSWSENLAVLAEKGIDAGLLEQLRKAGPEAAKTVELIVAASDKELKELNTTFQNGSKEATDALLRELGLPEVVNAGSDMVDNIAEGAAENKSMETEAVNLVNNTRTAMDNAVRSANFPAVGRNISAGVADGIRSGEGSVASAAAAVVRRAIDAAKQAADIHSPSKKAEAEIGKPIAEGVAEGVSKNSKAVSGALAGAVNGAIGTAADILAESSRSAIFKMGLNDAAPLVNKAAEMLGLASVTGVKDVADDGVSASGVHNSNVTNNAGDVNMYITIGTVNNSSGRDIQDLSEELAFYMKQQIRGAGA